MPTIVVPGTHTRPPGAAQPPKATPVPPDPDKRAKPTLQGR